MLAPNDAHHKNKYAHGIAANRQNEPVVMHVTVMGES
jgi:hypothetical protein